jgi:hypothetical protein
MFLPEFHITLGEARGHVMDCLHCKKVPMLRGSPGLGKSAVIHQVAGDMNLLVIDARFAGYDPTDINGFPHLDVEKGIAQYYPLETFPLDNWDLPINPETGTSYAGWLLFADELNSAPPAVQAASYKLFLDRMVGQRKLHPKVYMAAAGNLDSDGAVTHEMSTALISRVINYQIRHDLKSWLDWAHPAGMHSLVTSYLEFRTANFYTFNPDEPNQPFASPRTWEFTNDFLKYWETQNASISAKMPTLVGTLGSGIATDFKAFANIRGKLPNRATVLGNPDNAPLPNDLGPLYAMTGALADWADPDDNANVEAILKYTSRLQPADFQVTTIRNLNARNEKFKTHPEVQKWMLKNMDAFLG